MIGNLSRVGRSSIRPQTMSRKEYTLRIARARQRAQTALAHRYPEEFEILLNKERESEGVGPKQYQVVATTKSKTVVAARRFFILARNHNAAVVWCAKHDLGPQSKAVYYIGSAQSLRGMKIDLSQDAIVFIHGWRDLKSYKACIDIEEGLQVDTAMSWIKIIEHPRTLHEEL